MTDSPASTPDPSGISRTPTGDLAPTTTNPAATTGQTSTTTDPKPSLANEPAGSVVNQPVSPPAGAPETYAAWNVPDGWQLDPAINTEAIGLFKGMNISQVDGQKLIDFYIKHTGEAQNQPYQAWNDMQEKWVTEIKADPNLGPKLDHVKTTISKAIDGLGDAKLASDFRAAMDFTGAGNNPAFVRAFYKLAQMITEGGHVSGRGPSAAGQRQPGTPVSAAGAMYPNLPRA